MVEALLGILGTTFLAVIGWTIQLGTRVSVTESKYEDLLVLIDSKFEDLDKRLERIERAMNGYLKKELH